MDIRQESKEYLSTQLITYLGNKRSLIDEIEKCVLKIKEKLGKDKCVCGDLFSGSGVVARMLKQHSSLLIVNDLEDYAKIINECYLSNKKDFDFDLYQDIRKKILDETNEIFLDSQRLAWFEENGIITKNYAPKNDDDIQEGERVFYCHENALRLDIYRALIEKYCDLGKRDYGKDMKKYFLAPLLTEASIHTNTSGVFKGFYKDKNTGLGCFGGLGKNALSRILGKIELCEPVLSNFESDVEIYQKDAVELGKELSGFDIVYLDPPYNQHPYGSNYFMLNVILKNKISGDVSKVSGITKDWNRSDFNRETKALESMEEIIKNLDSRFVVVSYNSEGFISFDEMTDMLERYGSLETVEIKYNTFRGSRNLRQRDIHVNEFLFVLEKKLVF